MIAMLRRRLMGNMAKAKNIVTGNVGVSGSTVTINNVGFKANHLVMFPITDIQAWSSTMIYEESAGVYVHLEMDGSYNLTSVATTVKFQDNSITVTNTGDAYPWMNGTYRYVAWQE